VKGTSLHRSQLDFKLKTAPKACGQVYSTWNFYFFLYFGNNYLTAMKAIHTRKTVFVKKSSREKWIPKPTECTKVNAQRVHVAQHNSITFAFVVIHLFIKFTPNPQIRALVADLDTLRKTEPSMHCVVFTNSNESHDLLVRKLFPKYKICEFCGGDNSKKRDSAIRQFQQGLTGGPATVFVVTMKACAVGITLTAATRCYLL